MVTTDFDYGYPEQDDLVFMVKEPDVLYGLQDGVFQTAEFESLNSILEFSQAEWADILHISDRTLQRYLKEGKPFDGLQAELLFHLEKLVKLGRRLFESNASFIDWLRHSKEILGQTLGFDALKSITGIQLLKKELGRIAYGVYI